MAFDRNQFNILFPRDKKPPFDPIKPSPVETQADSIMEGATSSSPDPIKRLPVTPLERTEAPQESGFVENLGRLFGAGTVQVGEMGVGALEYGARQFDITDGIVADTLYAGRDRLGDVRESILSGISEEDRRQVESELLTLDPNRTIWTSPLDAAEAVIYKTVQALPATLVTMIPAIRWARAASPAKAMAYMGASEGVMSMGGIQNGIADEIMAVPTEQLLQESPRFAELLQEMGGNADEARKSLIAEAQGFAPLVGGATVAAISSVAGRYFTPIFEKGGGASLGNRVATGFVAESIPEGAQGGVEQVVQNYAAKIYDLDRQLSQGVGEAIAQEGLIGGVMGGGAGGMFGQRPTPERPPIDPNARPDITEQQNFGGPLAPGGAGAPREVEYQTRGGETRTGILPDALDTPTPEPEQDIRAQIDDLLNPESSRNGVYISPGTDERYVAKLSETLPDELVFVRNVDGKGGHLITKSAELGLRAQEAIANGASHQEVIGRITGIGVGKPTNPDSRVVQLLAADGSVARESMQPSQQAAEKLGVAWSKEEGNKDLRVAILSPQQAVERRQQMRDFNVPTGDVSVQEDMFDNRAARGTDLQTTPTEAPAPGQIELPLLLRRKGQRPGPMEKPEGVMGPEGVPYRTRGVEDTVEGKPVRVGQQDRVGPAPADQYVDEEAGPDPYEISRRQYGMNFDEPAVETKTARGTRRVKTGEMTVQVLDNGEVVEEQTFANQEEAEAYADYARDEFPDFQVRMAPKTKTEGTVQTRARKGTSKPLEPVYETPIEDEIRGDIQTTVPFEEREGAYRAVEGSRSVQQASEKLVGEAAATRAEEERERIGGFYNPARLEFADPEQAQAYQEAWSQLVDAELTIEMSNQKQAVERAKKRKQRLFQELGEIRQVAKPKVKPGRSAGLIKAAARVSPATAANLRERTESNRVDRDDRQIAELKKAEEEKREPVVNYGTATPQRASEKDFIGEFSAMSREEIDKLEGRDLERALEQAIIFREGREATSRNKAAPKKQKIPTVVYKNKDGVNVTRAFDTVEEAKAEVERLKEQGISAKLQDRKVGEAKEIKETEEDTVAVDKKQSTDALTGKLEFTENVDDEGEYVTPEEMEDEGQTVATYTVDRKKLDTPGKKKKFIRREAEHARRKETGQRSVKAATVRASTVTRQTVRLIDEKGVIVKEKTVADKYKAERQAEIWMRKAEPGQSVDIEPVVTSLKRKEGESEADFQKRVARAEGKKKFDTAPLTQENYKLDESVDDREARVAKAKEVRSALGKAATAANKVLRQYSDKRAHYIIGEAYGEKVQKDFLYARTYLRNLIEFARSIQAAKSESDATIKLAEGITNMLNAAVDLEADVFASEWGAIARANEFDDLSALKGTDLATLRDPKKREKATKKSLSAINSRAKLHALNEQLRSDSLYQKLIAPVLNRMSWSLIDNIEGRYTNAYLPSAEEVEMVKYAMMTWKNTWKPTREAYIFNDIEYNPLINRTQMYKELRQILRRAGFTFDEAGNVSGFEPSDNYQSVAAKTKMGEAGAAGGVTQPVEWTHESLNREMTRSVKRAEEQATQDNREAAAAARLYDKVNGLIEAFRAKTNTAKVTISGIKRQEQRFIRGLNKLGVWRQTGPSTGQINLEGFSVKTVTLVASRLDSKSLTKQQAKNIVQRIAPFPIPRKLKPFLTAARKEETYTAGVEKFLSENDIELFNEAAKPIEYDAEYTEVVDRVNEKLTSGKITGNDIIDAILELAPQNSFYRNLAERLSRRDVANVEVTFGTEEDFPKGQPGKYLRSKNRIILNRDVLKMGDPDSVHGARVVHTLTHELIHAQTHLAIDNPNGTLLKQRLMELRRQAKVRWQRTVDKSEPYGLRDGKNELHEFIAEAFSNPELQTFLKETPHSDGTLGSVWNNFVQWVRETLGLPPRKEVKNNLFDAIMLTEDVLFDDAGFGTVAQGELYMTGDAVLDRYAEEGQEVLQKSWGWLKDLASGGLRNIMSFEQLHENYARWFDDFKDGDNPFNRYLNNWRKRNAAISGVMRDPKRIHQRWTEFDEQKLPDGDSVGNQISRLGSFATLHRVTAAKELTAAERAEIDPAKLAKYDEARRMFNELTPEAQEFYKDVSQWYKDAAVEEANLLLSSSLRGILTKGPGAKITTEQFEKDWPMSRIRKMKDKDGIKAELAELVPEEDLDGLAAELQRMASLRTIGYGDYFPLMRYGDYTVEATRQRADLNRTFTDTKEAYAYRSKLLTEDPTLDVGIVEKGTQVQVRVQEKFFGMYESKTEAEKARRGEASELDESWDIGPVNARMSSTYGDVAIPSNAALNNILTSLKDQPAAQRAIKESYLKSLSDASFRKHELKRKNRLGINANSQHRNFANYMKQSAYHRAQLEYGWRMAEALQDMDRHTRGRKDQPGMTTEKLQQIVKHVIERDRYTNNEGTMRELTKAGVNFTQFMMLTSPSYWMINATQPWLVSAPVLSARHGIGATMAAMKHVQGLITSPLIKGVKESGAGAAAFYNRVGLEKGFDVAEDLKAHLKNQGLDGYADVIQQLQSEYNIIDINVLTELREVAEGVEGGITTKILDASRILAHITEVNNRALAALSAYQLEINKGATHEAAVEYAAKVVSQTQFNYSAENKPLLFQKAPLMFQFMQWPQHMYALLIRNFRSAVGRGDIDKVEARKALAGLLGTHAMVGGVVGMALQPIKWAIGALMLGFSDDDDPLTAADVVSGRAFDNWVAGAFTEAFGDTAGRALSHGLPTLFGTDLSARMSMGTLYFVDLRGDTAESMVGSLAASFGGATLNQGINMARGFDRIMNGDVLKGVEGISPKIFRDMARTFRYYNEGLVNQAGDTVIPAADMKPTELALQFIGFNPDTVSKHYAAQNAIKGAQGFARDRRADLIRKFVDDGMSAEIMREVTAFNRAYPSMRITRSTLIRGARGRLERESRYRRYGANIDEKQATDFAEFGEPYRNE